MRRLLPRASLAARGPWLAGSLVLVFGAIVMFGTGHDFVAVPMIGAAIFAVVIAKSAGP